MQDDLKNQVKENQEHDFYIKSLNGTMIILLDNSDASIMYNVLFDSLIKYRRNSNVSSKNISLLIKCLLKITKDLNSKITNLDLDMMFKKFNEYLIEFASDPNKN